MSENLSNQADKTTYFGKWNECKHSFTFINVIHITFNVQIVICLHINAIAEVMINYTSWNIINQSYTASVHKTVDEYSDFFAKPASAQHHHHLNREMIWSYWVLRPSPISAPSLWTAIDNKNSLQKHLIDHQAGLHDVWKHHGRH